MTAKKMIGSTMGRVKWGLTPFDFAIILGFFLPLDLVHAASPLPFVDSTEDPTKQRPLNFSAEDQNADSVFFYQQLADGEGVVQPSLLFPPAYFLDTDKDGKLSQDELSAAIDSSTQPPQPRMDVNGDGQRNNDDITIISSLQADHNIVGDLQKAYNDAYQRDDATSESNVQFRIQIAEQLAEIAKKNPMAIPVLITILGDSDEPVKTKASDALVSLGASAIPSLIRALGDEKTRANVKEVLARFSGEAKITAIDQLVSAVSIKDQGEPIREQSAILLGELLRDMPKDGKFDDWVNRLKNVANDPTTSVKLNNAIKGTLNFFGIYLGPPLPLNPLILASEVDSDHDGTISHTEFTTFQQSPKDLNGDKIVDSLDVSFVSAGQDVVDSLQQTYNKPETSPGMRVDILKELGVIGNSKAIGVLITALGDEDPTIKGQAKSELGKLAETKAGVRKFVIEALVAALGAEKTRQGAQEVLEGLAENAATRGEVIQFLVRGLGDKKEISEASERVLLNVTQKSGELKDLVLNELLTQLGSKEISATNGIKKGSATLLGKLGDTKAIPALIEAWTLTDPDKKLQEDLWQAVHNALLRLTKQTQDSTKDDPEKKTVVITELINKGLRHGNPKVREESAKLLGELRTDDGGYPDRVLPLIGIALTDVDSSVRTAAATALGNIGDLRALPTLVTALGDKVEGVVNSAKEALKNLANDSTDARTKVIGELVKALTNPKEKPEIQRHSAILLGDLQATEAVDQLSAIVNTSTDAGVQVSAIIALGSIGKGVAAKVAAETAADQKQQQERLLRSILQKLMNFLGDKDLTIRLAARTQLRTFNGTPQEKTAVNSVLITQGLASGNVNVRKASAFLLGEMKVVEAIDLLAKLLVGSNADSEISVRASAAEALGKIASLENMDETKRQKAIHTLVEALADSFWVNSRVQDALTDLDGKSISEIIKSGLTHENAGVRRLSAKVLGDLRTKPSATVTAEQLAGAVPVLSQLALSEAEPNMVKRQAVETLGEIGSSIVVPTLVKALGDGDSPTRSRARAALKNIIEANSQSEDFQGEIIGALTDELSKGDKTNELGRIEILKLLGEIELPTESAGKMAGPIVGAAIQVVGDIGELAGVRVQGIKTLGQLEVAEGNVPSILLSATGDSHIEVALSAQKVLRSFLNDSDTRQKTIDALFDGLKDSNEKIRQLAVQLLGEKKVAGAVDDLIGLAGGPKSPSGSGRDPSAAVRKSAIEALGNIGAVEGQVIKTLAALVGAFGDEDKGVRESAQKVVSDFAKNKIVDIKMIGEALQNGLKSENAQVRATSAELLTKLGIK